MIEPFKANIRTACDRIPPLWPLKNFVAVNPFVGLADHHFLDAAHLMQRIGHGEMLMPAKFYEQQLAAGRIREQDLEAALKTLAKTLPAGWADHVRFTGPEALKKVLADSPSSKPVARVLTFADFLAGQGLDGWSTFLVEEISKWCSAYFDQGQSSWRMPWRHLGLFPAWKQAAQIDANPEMNGLKQFRDFIGDLTDDHLEFIDQALVRLGVPGKLQTDFLHRQLMSVPGWSSYVQYQVREQSMAGRTDDSLAQLLAIRLAYDLALLNQFGGRAGIFVAWKNSLRQVHHEIISPDLFARYVAQLALERRFQHDLIAKLKTPPPRPASAPQKTLQAVFCIDVRSEIFRRSLEAQSADLATIGFAGFFGMAIEYLKFGRDAGAARCPVLLTPKIKVRESLPASAAGAEAALLRSMNFRQTVSDTWNSFKTSAIACFSFVETAGLGFGLRLAADALALAAPESAFAPVGGRLGPAIEHVVCCPDKPGHTRETGIPLADQIALAAGALKNMGLTTGFAKVVLICGHGSATANNPYGSALDCGACGGHPGDVNARVAVTILNQPGVRAGLRQQGIIIPAETLFIAGLHNTTTDEVTIYDIEAHSRSRPAELNEIVRWLAAASKIARRERAPSLGLADCPDYGLNRELSRRSRDWSQVRPEWGLAGNAAFIAAPRERTRGINLGGRVFLHDYHPASDADKSTLELIMIAPMVVASWINLQYYGSTVDNRLFGSGNKVLHNVVGTFGVWQGNGGDLQPGLPMQSLHDGERWMHEPLRLNVFIQAGCDEIANIIARQPGVRELVENGWVNLFAMDAAGGSFWRWRQERFEPEPI